MADFANFCHQTQMFECIFLSCIYLMHVYDIFLEVKYKHSSKYLNVCSTGGKNDIKVNEWWQNLFFLYFFLTISPFKQSFNQLTHWLDSEKITKASHVILPLLTLRKQLSSLVFSKPYFCSLIVALVSLQSMAVCRRVGAFNLVICAACFLRARGNDLIHHKCLESPDRCSRGPLGPWST